MSDETVRFVGPGIRRPLDPNQRTRNLEAVLRVTDPHSSKDTNLLKCIRLSWYLLPEDKRGLECTGYLITTNEEFLKRISRVDTAFTWSLDSTGGLKGKWSAKLEAVPDFSADEVVIRLIYDAPT